MTQNPGYLTFLNISVKISLCFDSWKENRDYLWVDYKVVGLSCSMLMENEDQGDGRVGSGILWRVESLIDQKNPQNYCNADPPLPPPSLSTRSFQLSAKHLWSPATLLEGLEWDSGYFGDGGQRIESFEIDKMVGDVIPFSIADEEPGQLKTNTKFFNKKQNVPKQPLFEIGLLF